MLTHGTYLIDTDVCIELTRKNPIVVEHVRAVGAFECKISDVTLAEMYFGAYYSSDFERHIKEPEWLRRYITVLDISEVFDEYAQIRCALKQKKKTLERE